MNIVVFLQNAWSPVYAGRTWPRRSWLMALERSRSGQRLRHLIDDYNVCEQSSPVIHDNPRTIAEADHAHITTILKRRNPDVVVCCGDVARKALVGLWNGPLLAVPHPACRVLTNALYQEGRRLLSTSVTPTFRVQLRQTRDGIVMETL